MRYASRWGASVRLGQCTGTPEDRTRSLFQLVGSVAVVEVMKGVLSGGCRTARRRSEGVLNGNRRKTRTSIPMSEQELRFNGLDKRLLEYLCIRVVASPGI